MSVFLLFCPILCYTQEEKASSAGGGNRYFIRRGPMLKNHFSKPYFHPGIVLFCLLLFMMITPGGTRTVHGKTPGPSHNISGNLNLPLSVDPVRKSEGYSAVLYDSRNGLPTSEANAIAQTSEGFLWIGSYSGLIRYDGSTFERIDSTSGISSVRCLYVDSQDRLWIGTNDAGVFLMSNGNFRNWNKTNGLKSVSIRAVVEGEDGIIYLGSTTGVAMIDKAMNLTLLEDDRIADQTIRYFKPGTDGQIYGLTQLGDIFVIKNGRLLTFLGHNECRINGILAMIPDPRHPGNIYLGTENSKIYYGNLENNFASLGIKDISPLSYTETFEYIDGEIWICAGNGIGKLGSDGFHRLTSVPMNTSVGHVMTDYEGNLWFTSTRQGIMKIVPNQFSNLSERYELPANVVNSTCMYGRQLFIGTDTGLIVIEERKKLDSLPLTEAVTASGTDLHTTDLLKFLDGVRIRSIIRDSQGRLWISTWRRYGVLCYDQGKLKSFSQKDGLFSDQVRAVSECEDGTILVANTGGVSIIQDDLVTTGYGEAGGINCGDTLTVIEGFHHEIILGTDGNGIYVINDGEIKHLGTEDGLNSEVILRIKRSRLHNIFWIITSNSIAYMTPDFQITTIHQFPYSNNYDLLEAENGNIWILSSNGIYVVPAEKLLENGPVDPVFYGISSGLPYVATANSYSEMTAGGDLYISGTAGVVMVNIEKPFEDISELKTALPYIDADAKRYYPDSEGNFQLPGNVRKLTIYPYVFNYSMADPQVSCRLDGFDTTDTTVSCSKMTPQDYTNLKSGTFHFVMTVKDTTGQSEQTVSFQITKGKEMSAGTAGTVIMNAASLLLMAGTMIYAASDRRRKRIEDHLLFALLLTNVILAVSELLSCILEYTTFSFVRELMITGYTVFYIALVLFAYLLFFYFDYCTDRERIFLRKTRLLYGIPCCLFFILMVVNLKTGWIFSIGEGNSYSPGSLAGSYWLPQLPVLFYILLSLMKIFRVAFRMAVIGILLTAALFLFELCYQEISSISFIYTLILVSIHIYLVNRPVREVIT